MRFCKDLCLAVVLIRIAWTDIRTMMIPDRVLVPLMILAGLSVFTEPEIPFTARLIGIFCTALPMYLANLFVDGAFGGGDIRLLAAAGFCLGWKTCLIGTITGLFLGGLQSVVLLALGKVRFRLLRRSVWDCLPQAFLRSRSSPCSSGEHGRGSRVIKGGICHEKAKETWDGRIS